MSPELDDQPGGKKPNEKEREKRQEKGQGLDEKYRRNPLGFVAWALVIIWFGVTMLLQNLDLFADGNEDQQWAIFVWGAGAIFLIEACLRLVVPRWRRSVLGSFVWGAVLVVVGFGLWYDKWEVVGPIIVIAIGVGILVGRLVPRR
jgi:hypothetical protein